MRQYAGNGDDWTTGDIYLWGACLQQGTDPKKAYARTWGYQAALLRRESPAARSWWSRKDNAESPFRVARSRFPARGPHAARVTSGGELIIAGGTGNGYRLAEIVGASNPSGWSGCLKVKNPAGVTAGYILLYSNP